MGIRCKICGRFVEPTKKAMEGKICGFCIGASAEGKKECFDGSPCTKPDEDCNKCEWMKL